MQDHDEVFLEVLSCFLLLNGISKSRQNNYISNILGISTSAGYKRLNGSTKWEVEQLRKIIESLGATMSEFFEAYDAAGDMVHATWVVGKHIYHCNLILYPEHESTEADLCALKIGDKWNVVNTEELNPKEGLFFDSIRKIKNISIKLKNEAPAKTKIAILDDDPDIGFSLKELLENDGYQVNTYSTLEALDNSMNTGPYDAYILDWVIGDKTVINLIHKIRETSSGNAMVIVVTGQLHDINDSDLSTAIHDLDIVGPFTKPVKYSIIHSQINKYFSGQHKS